MDNEAKFQPFGRQSQDILNEAWTEAARVNPMLLAKLRPDYDFEKLKQRIRDRLDKGLSGAEVRLQIVDELLRSAGDSGPPVGFDDKKPRQERAPGET